MSEKSFGGGLLSKPGSKLKRVASPSREDVLESELVMRHRVLVLNGNALQSRQLKQSLEGFGYDVLCVSSTASARQALESQSVSLVISDADAEGHSGEEFVAEMRADQRYARTPVILMTPVETESGTLNEVSALANDIVVKPFHTRELRIRLQNLISLAEYEQYLTDENRMLTLELGEKNVMLEDSLTKLQKAHDETRALQAQLVQSARMAGLGSLSTGLAHEINNPLAIIFGHTSRLGSVIKKGIYDADTLTKAHEKIKSSSERIARIVESLRDLSAHHKPDTQREVEIDALLPTLVDFFGERAHERGIDIRFDLKAPHAEISGDPALIRQAVLAVISNAVDAMEANAEHVARTLTLRTEASDSHVIVTVSDTGHGVAEAIRDKIYDPFFTTRDPDRGTGLGLTMAYHTLQECHGTIDFDCPPEGGTRFHLRFPHKK